MQCRFLSMAMLVTACGANFLRNSNPAGDHASLSHMEKDVAKVRQALLDEIQSGLGDSRHATHSRLTEHEDAMRSMFAALPKNNMGRLNHSVVRYAMHRYFAQTRAWSLKGLDPAGDHYNASSPAKVLLDRVPALVQDMFEERLHGNGMSLQDVAGLTVTMEHIIHDEALQQLKAVYDRAGLSTTKAHSRQEAEDAISTFMMMFSTSTDIQSLSDVEVRAHKSSMNSMYPGWKETLEFVSDTFKNVTTDAKEFSFETSRSVAMALQDTFGPWQDHECQSMKKTLIDMEENDNGRVKLADFYGSNLNGVWQFAESIDYLRQSGALDESNPSQPRVILTNYMYGGNNCVAKSGLYSVCCVNECEAILSQIEKRVAGPRAFAKDLAMVVADVPSATVAAPRNLSESLIRRLEEIDQHHENAGVPLHGRLFSQWLHHAFPRECPFPHQAGTSSPMTAEEWMNETGERITFSRETIRNHVKAAQQTDMDDLAKADPIPWHATEELIHPAMPVRLRSAEHFRTLGRGMACILSCATLFGVLFKQAPKMSTSKADATLFLPMVNNKRHMA